MTTILFVCVKNGGKSQMAAGLLRKLLAEAGDESVYVASAGTAAGHQLNQLSVEVLNEVGATMTDPPRQLTRDLQNDADWVITLGSEAKVEALPGPRYETWETDEPSLRGIEGVDRMRLVRDDIAHRVNNLYKRLSSQES